MGVGRGLCALAALMDEMATPETLVKYKSQSLSFSLPIHLFVALE
jgi:hypothetical protein